MGNKSEIQILTNTPNGTVVEYGPDDDAGTVEAAVGNGWSVDWETPTYRMTSGRFRAPLIAKSPSITIVRRGGDRLVVSGHEYLFVDDEEALAESTRSTTNPGVIELLTDSGRLYAAAGDSWINDDGERGRHWYGVGGASLEVVKQ